MMILLCRTVRNIVIHLKLMMMRPLEYGGREEIIDKQGHKAPRGLHE